MLFRIIFWISKNVYFVIYLWWLILEVETPDIASAQPEIFQGKGGFVKLGHFDKHFIKKSRKKARKIFWSFLSLRYSWNYILKGKFNPRIDTIRAFFSKIRTLFLIFKKEQGRFSPSSPPLVARLHRYILIPLINVYCSWWWLISMSSDSKVIFEIENAPCLIY